MVKVSDPVSDPPYNVEQEHAMKKLISGISLMLPALPALADEAVAVTAPQVEANPMGLIIFAVLMVGMIGGYVGYIWMKERANKDQAE